MIKEDLGKLAALPRWIPHDKNPSDALTKDQGSHAVPLHRLLQDHVWRIMFEEEELKLRAEVREKIGYNPRPRQSYFGTLATVPEELGYVVEKVDRDF